MLPLDRPLILAVAMTVALTLSGCGGGGSPGTPLGDELLTDDDGQPEDSAQVMRDAWQQFAEGDSGLELSTNDFVDLHTQTSQDIRSDGNSVEDEYGEGWWVTGLEGDYYLDDGSWRPGSRHEEIGPGGGPEHTLTLTPQIRGIFLPDLNAIPDYIDVSFNPVLEHNGIKLINFEAMGVFEEDGFREIFEVDLYWGYGEWSLFMTDTEVECEEHAVDSCSEIHADEPDYEFASAGHWTGENPQGLGSAAWSGIMFGRDVTQYEPGNAGRILGEARIEIDDLSSPYVDVRFAGVTDLETGTARADMAWTDLSLEGGAFNDLSPGERVTISGAFYGPSQQEAGGIFDRDGIVGAFGAVRHGDN